MKKKLILNMTVSLAFILSACSPEQKSNVTDPKKIVSNRGGGGSTAGKDETGDLGAESSAAIGKGTKTLFAIYLLGSDLEDDVEDPKGTADEVSANGIVTKGAGSDDLREINEALKNMTPDERANIDIIVGFGGARKQGWKGIKYADGNCIMKDVDDNYFGNSDCYAKKDETVSMGKGQTLADFVTYVKDNYPAANYGKRIIDLWDHGGAHLGYGPDTNTDESMTLKEINDALAKDPVKYDMVGFDACLMGNLEVAKFVQRRANYLLASEELEPGHGWQYTEVLNLIAKNPNFSIVDIGKGMVDSFVKIPDSDGKTLSLVDLSKLNDVYTPLDTLSNSLTQSLDSNMGPLAQSAEKAEIYGKTSKGTGFNFDINSFITEFKKRSPSVDFAPLEASIKNYVLYAKNDGTRPRSTGVALFDINNKKHIVQGTYNIDRAATPNWFNFVNTYTTKARSASGGKPSVSATTISDAMATSAFSLKADSCADNKCFKIIDDVGIKSVNTIKAIQIGNSSKYSVIGADEAKQISKDTYRAVEWDGKALMIDGTLVPTELFDILPNGDKIFISDGLLNGEDVVFNFRINKLNQVVKSYATPFDITDKGDFRLSKEQLPLEKNDIVQFYTNVIDIESDSEDEWDLGKETKLTNIAFTFGSPEGTPYVFLEAEDVGGNLQNTDIVPLK